MRHVHALGAVALVSLACGGLTLSEEAPAPPPEAPVPVVEASCDEPTCARVGRDLVVRSQDQRLVVVVRGELTGQRFEEGRVRAVELDDDLRGEILVARDLGWWVLDCGPGGRCEEAPLMEGPAEIRVADGSDGHHQAWGLGPGTLTCRELVRGRAEPCPGWKEDVGPVLVKVTPSQTPGPDSDGKVVASVDLDLDADGRAEHVACAWVDGASHLRCSTELHGAEAAIPSSVEVAFSSIATNGVLDVIADGRTGRWDGAGWVFAW